MPVAYVTIKPGATATSAEIGAFADPLIADPPARPKRVVIVDAMPLTAIGKIYKPKLRQAATEWAFREAIDALPGGGTVELRSMEGNGPIRMQVIVPAIGGDALVEALKICLRDFAVPYEISVARSSISNVGTES